MPLVSISDVAARAAAAAPTGSAPCITACRRACYCFGRGAGGYLAFLGRISPEKAPTAAIAIARRAGMPLQDRGQGRQRSTRTISTTQIEPLLGRSRMSSSSARSASTRRANFSATRAALLFPIDWPEPFGLVMIEAMACGTPVIAFRRGSVPEVIERRRHRLHRRRSSEAAAGGAAAAIALDRAARPPRFSRSASPPAHGARIICGIYRAAGRARDSRCDRPV